MPTGVEMEVVFRLNDGTEIKQIGYLDDVLTFLEEHKEEFVKVVRCKDCKHLMSYNDGTYDCKYLAERMFAEGELNNNPDDFCCWGERKDGGENG